MVMNIIGREEEQEILNDFLSSSKAEFLAIYGRRRIGKTFLIKNYMEKQKCVFFNITGIQKGTLSDQIERFLIEIGRVFYNGGILKKQDSWFHVFDVLKEAIDKFVSKKQKVVLFFDEFPWMSTHRSKLLSVIEHFWNQYWCNDHRIKLIICGSSASWIIKKIINNKGGLHNRITKKIQLQPFCLKEVKLFLVSLGIKLNSKQISQLYMVTGGIPYYLSEVKKGLSIPQLIEHLAFKQNSLLLKEFDNLFSSLFDVAEPYIELLRIIAKHRNGISQEDIIKLSKHTSRGGRAGEKLQEMEEAGFIISFTPHFHEKRGIYYRIYDEYSLFYLKWIEPVRKTLQKNSLESGYWEKMHNQASWLSWSGLAFEAICYKHIYQIRKKLMIRPDAIANAWRYAPKIHSKEDGTQIDLLFDRNDDTISLCEIKYTEKPFMIDKKYAENLKNKVLIFKEKTRTHKQIFVTMVSAAGINSTIYSEEIIDSVVTLEDLFN